MTLYILLRDHNLTPYNYSKKGPNGVMLKTIKDLSMSSSSPISFKVEWHNSWSDKWYQSQGHGFESRECYCERGIVGGTTIWLPTTTLKIGPCGMMSKTIKDLSIFLITNWFWGRMAQLTVRQMVSEPRLWVRVMGVSLWERDCWADHNLTSYNHSKNRPMWRDVECHKRF